MIKRLAVSSFLILVSTTQAYASDAASSDHGTGHEEQAGGLPQLDPSSFESQTFWLVIIFVGLYFIFSKKSLPNISQTIENRAERVKNDLDSAEDLKEQVTSVRNAYEEKLKEARNESSLIFKKIEEDLKANSDKQTIEFQGFSANKVSELEANIAKARDSAMDEMTEIAADIAAQAAEKIIGVKADAKSARDVVKSINKAA